MRFPADMPIIGLNMFSEEMTGVLFYVITSWHVIGVTAALILYLSLVGYVARSYRRPRFVSKSRPRKSRKAAAATASSSPIEASDSADTNEALGLEED